VRDFQIKRTEAAATIPLGKADPCLTCRQVRDWANDTTQIVGAEASGFAEVKAILTSLAITLLGQIEQQACTTPTSWV
jgi:hypothetical protein